MASDINIEQMKEFLEFRLDKVEAKVDTLGVSLEKSVVHSVKVDEQHAVALEKIAGRVNTVFKVSGAIVTAAGIAFTVVSYMQ